MSENSQLALLQNARTALSQVATVDDAREIRDKADAVRHYARQAKLGQELIIEAAVVKLRAERRLGQILGDMQLATGVRGNQHAESSGEPNGALLSELGINKSESSRMQRIAELDEKLFETYIQSETESRCEPTIMGVMRLVRESKRPSSRATESPPVDYESFASIDELIRADRRFKTVLITPPFDVLSFEQLERERIREVVDEDTNVFLWAHPDRLIETLDLADCWGLGYRRAIISIPPKTFMLEQSPHLLLHFQIGDAKLVDTDIASWILCPQPDDVGVPHAVRHAIQRRASLPLLEIFAKARPPNSDWTVVDYPAQSPMA